MNASAERDAQLLQWAIAAVFLVLGAWCLVAPVHVLELTVRSEHQTDSPVVAVAIGAFGAQAVLAGLFAAFSRFTRLTFIIFGLALLPFFVFDYWFYAVEPLFNELILLDVVGNIVMLGLCARGAWLLRQPR